MQVGPKPFSGGNNLIKVSPSHPMKACETLTNFEKIDFFPKFLVPKPSRPLGRLLYVLYVDGKVPNDTLSTLNTLLLSTT